MGYVFIKIPTPADHQEATSSEEVERLFSRGFRIISSSIFPEGDMILLVLQTPEGAMDPQEEVRRAEFLAHQFQGRLDLELMDVAEFLRRGAPEGWTGQGLSLLGNTLKRAGVSTVGQLLLLDAEAFRRIRGLGNPGKELLRQRVREEELQWYHS